MKRMAILSIVAILPLGAVAYGQNLGEGTGGAVARQWNAPTGASGGGHAEPMGFSLLSTNNCWADADVGCNATPRNAFVDASAQPAASTEDPPKAAPKH